MLINLFYALLCGSRNTSIFPMNSAFATYTWAIGREKRERVGYISIFCCSSINMDRKQNMYLIVMDKLSKQH